MYACSVSRGNTNLGTSCARVRTVQADRNPAVHRQARPAQTVRFHDAIVRFLHLHVAVAIHASTRYRAPQALVGLERGASCFNNPVVPDDEGLTLLPYTGDDCLTYEGEINKMAVNVAFGRYTKTARIDLEDLEQTASSFGMTSCWAQLGRRLSVPLAWARPLCITAT